MSSGTYIPADPAKVRVAGGECLNSLYPIGTMWVGTTRGGDPMQFKDLELYRQYNTRTGCPDVSQPVVPREEKRQITPFIPFMEFKPHDPYQQSLYSAMSQYWVGAEREKQLPSSSVFR